MRLDEPLQVCPRDDMLVFNPARSELDDRIANRYLSHCVSQVIVRQAV